MKHSQENKDRWSVKHRDWAASLTDEKRAEMSLKAIKTRVARGTSIPERKNASWKAAWHEIGGKRNYYRSRWEANYAYYLEWLKQRGEIRDWAHEPKTFWFEAIKRGSVSYLPDFLVVEKSGDESYHEVKGWMDDRSRVKLERMARYYPEVTLHVIDSKKYKTLRRQVASIVPGWSDE